MRGRSIVEDREKAKQYLQSAQQFADSKDHQTAIEMLNSSFAFTTNTQDYRLLPLQYAAMREPLKVPWPISISLKDNSKKTKLRTL